MYEPSESEITAWLARNSGSPFAVAREVVRRVVIRSCRIALGTASVGLGLFAGDKALELLGRPFVVQSMLGIIGGLCAAIGALWLLASSWPIAFGAGPGPEEQRQRRRARACLALQQGYVVQKVAEGDIRRQREAVQRSYARGRALGRLLSRL